jgi:ankyrin repeat protein
MFWWQCIHQGSIAKVNRFLLHSTERRYHQLVHALWINNSTTIHTVCNGGQTQGHCDVLRLMINNDVPVNGIDSDGNTGLHLALIWGFPRLVSILLQANARVDIYNYNHKTPLKMTRDPHCREIVIAFITAKKWKKWAIKKRRYRERRHSLLIWYKLQLSCEFKNLVHFL